MILTTNADSLRQWERSVAQSFPATLTILQVVQQTLAPSYASSDANSRISKCNLVHWLELTLIAWDRSVAVCDFVAYAKCY